MWGGPFLCRIGVRCRDRRTGQCRGPVPCGHRSGRRCPGYRSRQPLAVSRQTVTARRKRYGASGLGVLSDRSSLSRCLCKNVNRLRFSTAPIQLATLGRGRRSSFCSNSASGIRPMLEWSLVVPADPSGCRALDVGDGCERSVLEDGVPMHSALYRPFAD